MPRDRLSIKKLTLIERTTLHTHIVPTPTIRARTTRVIQQAPSRVARPGRLF